MHNRLLNFLSDEIERVEERTGYSFSDSEREHLLIASLLKLEAIQKPIEYLPILYESELEDHVRRVQINQIGGVNYVCDMRKKPV